MKRGKKLLLLMGALVLMVGLVFLVISLTPEEEQTQTPDVSISVFSLDPAKVTRIKWQYSYEASFSRTENGWVNDADSTFPVNGQVLDKMTQVLQKVEASKVIAQPAELSEYGLDYPVCSISITVDGKTHELAIGNQNAYSGGRYFTNGDGKVYMVQNDIVNAFAFDAMGALQMEAIPDMSGVDYLKAEKPEGTFEVFLKKDSDLAYTSHYKWFMDDKILDTEDVDAIVAKLQALQWRECATHNVTDAQLAEFKLDNPRVITVGSGDKSFVLELGKETDKGIYARIAGSKMVYYVGKDISNAVDNIRYSNLRPDEIIVMEWDKVDSMDIILEGKTYSLIREEEADENGCATGIYRWMLNGQKVESAALIEAIGKLETVSRSEEKPAPGAQMIKLVFHRNTTNFETIELAFYSKDSESCIVTFDGETTVLAKKFYVDKLVTAAQAITEAK